MTDDLKLPQVGELTLPQWQYWLARYNEILTERNARIEKLGAALDEAAFSQTLFDAVVDQRNKANNRIEKLEAALQELLSLGEWGLNDLARTVAREALEGKEGA